MKLAIPVIILATLSVFILYRSQDAAPHLEKKDAKAILARAETPSEISSAENKNKAGASADTLQTVRPLNIGLAQSMLPVRETTINKVVNEEIESLEEPLRRLFEEWKLDETALQKVLDIQREKSALAAKGQTGSNIQGQVNKRGNASADAKLIEILGSVERLYKMSNVITQVKLGNFKSEEKARRAQDDRIVAKLIIEIDALKKTYGADYEKEFRSKYGEAASTLLQLVSKSQD